MKASIRLIQTITLLGLLLYGLNSMACTTDAWTGGVAGTPLPGSPTPEGVSRVSGLCGMALDAPGSVKDTSPVTEADAYIRFYVLADLASGGPVILEGFSDDAATASLFTVTFDGVNFEFDAGDGASGPVPGMSGWNMIEMYWAGGTGIDFWVNTDSADPPDGSISAAAGTLESVVMGATGTFDGTLTFDHYESHRDTPIGPALICDANADDAFSLSDILDVINEVYGAPSVLAVGQPDCNMDGSMSLSDILDTIQVVYPPAP